MKARWMRMRWMMLVLALGVFPLASDAWAKRGIVIPSSLRQDLPIYVMTDLSEETIAMALDMQRAGWRYIMPHPKGRYTSWRDNNPEGTWWIGYWQNSTTGSVSTITPYWDDDFGRYVGNGEGGLLWKVGLPPPYPDDLEWLLSSGGGPR